MTTVVWIHLFMTKMVTRQRVAQDVRNETVDLVVDITCKKKRCPLWTMDSILCFGFRVKT